MIWQMYVCTKTAVILLLLLPLQHVPNNYETDLIFPIVSKAAELADIDYHSSPAASQTALKVIGDHIRAVVYLMSDGVIPSNVGRGYVVRRLLRRVIMKVRDRRQFARTLWLAVCVLLQHGQGLQSAVVIGTAAVP